MACRLCDLGEGSLCQVMPTGSTSPDVYIVMDKPTDDDIRFMNLESGLRSKYLINSLKSVGLNNYRIFSVIRCSCNETPTDDEITKCRQFLMSDIYRSNPKVILAAGSLPTQVLLDTKSRITDLRGLKRDMTIYGKSFQVVPTYSPTYVINKMNDSITGEFMTDIKTVYKIVTGKFIDPTDRNHLEYAKDYNSFKVFYDTYLADEDMLAYDIETNAESVYSEDFKIIGWSLAKPQYGVYVCLDSLEYTMPDDDQRKCIDLLIDILKSKSKIIVHNSLYERPATYYAYGYEMPFDKVEDTMVMAKVLLGGKFGAGLKPNARRVGYPDWETDLTTIHENLKKLLKRCKLKKFLPLPEGCRDGRSMSDILNDLETEDGGVEKYEEIRGYYDEIHNIVLKYYNVEDEIRDIESRLSERFAYGFYNGIPGVIPYNWTPSRILCKYGATDSLATFDLYYHFIDRMKNESTDEVNLLDGYKFDLMEHYAGYELMMAGIHWDDSQAERDYRSYDNIRLICLKNMIFCDHPAMDQFLMDVGLTAYAPAIVYEKYNDYFWDTFHRRIELKDDNVYVMRYETGPGKSRTRKVDTFFDGLDVPDSILNDIKKSFLDDLKRDVDKATDPEELKWIINPGSPDKKYSKLYNDIVNTEDLRVGFLVNKVKDNIINSDDSGDKKDERPEFEKELIQLISDYLNIDDTDYDNMWDKFNEIKSLLKSNPHMKSEDLQEFVGDMNNIKLERTGEEFQLLAYDSMAATPINPDDSSTWTTGFKYNLNLRMFKKATKIMTSYIDGSVGRQSVYEVDRDKLRNGDEVIYRETNYDDLRDPGEAAAIPSDKDWLDQSEFGVGTTETGRWSSKFHVLPAGSTVKRLLNSRFVGGTILQPDFSANELRCVASAAHEDSMLQAFRDGADIHRFNASKVFNIPMEEVTHFQRRWSKTMCLHGDTKIRLLSGESKSIEELYNDFGNGTLNEYVYSYNDALNKIIPCKILSVDQNREETDYVEIELENGSKIYVTTDHPFVMRDGSSRNAEELSPGDSLMSTYFRETDNGEYKDLGEGYEEFIDPDGSWVVTHRRVAEFVDLEEIGESEPRTVVHHSDFNKRNNNPDNLKLVNYRDHMGVHAKSEYVIALNAIHDEIEDNLDKYSKYREYNSVDHTSLEEYLAELLVVNYRHKSSLLKKLSECDPSIRDIVSDVMNNDEFLECVDELMKNSYQNAKKEFFTENSKYVTVWSDDRRKAQSERMKASSRYKRGLLSGIVKYIKSLIDNDIVVNKDNFNSYRPYATYARYENIEDVTGKTVEEIIELARMLPNQHREVVELDTSDVSIRGADHMDDLWHSDNDYAVRFREHHSKAHRTMMSDMNRDPELNRSRQRSKIMKVINDMLSVGITKEYILENGFHESMDRLKELTGKTYNGYPIHRFVEYFDSIDEAVESAKLYNHKIKSVKVIHSDEPVKFYGMMINHCHNFLVETDASDEVEGGVFVENSFSILYGASVYSIAENYFNGDTKKAQEQLDGFYNAFPKLKEFIDYKHNEVQRTHKVATLTGRFVNIDFDPNDQKSFNAALRKSVNYSIQSTSSTMAAVVFCDIILYLKRLGYKTKGICFIHDSLESDVYPYELIRVIDYERQELATGAVDYFGIECKADVSMGYSMGHECEMSDLVILNDDYTEAVITLEGFYDEILDTINNWKLAYNLVEIIEEDLEDRYVPMSELFIARKAIDPTAMSMKKTGSVKVHIRYYNERGEIEPMSIEFHRNDIWDLDGSIYDHIIKGDAR